MDGLGENRKSGTCWSLGLSAGLSLWILGLHFSKDIDIGLILELVLIQMLFL